MFWFLGKRNADGTLAEAPISFGSKRIIAGMAVGLIMLCVYTINALGPNAPGADDLQGWARMMLMYIAVSVVIIVIAMIVFHILYSIVIAIWQRDAGEATIKQMIDSTIKEDERDQLISLKAMRIGYRIVGVGIVLTLAALMRGLSPVLALHVLMGATFLGCFVEGVAAVIYQEKGV